MNKVYILYMKLPYTDGNGKLISVHESLDGARDARSILLHNHPYTVGIIEEHDVL